MVSQLSEPSFKTYHRLFEKGKDTRNNNDSSFSQDLRSCVLEGLTVQKKSVKIQRQAIFFFLFSSNSLLSSVTH